MTYIYIYEQGIFIDIEILIDIEINNIKVMIKMWKSNKSLYKHELLS